MLTDGAAEAQDRDGAFFETERVLRVIAEARHRSSAQIVESLRVAVDAFSQGSAQADDITVVVCKAAP
jgi:serine phosphatase RsbU (regulator of sigma subunit)